MQYLQHDVSERKVCDAELLEQSASNGRKCVVCTFMHCVN